MLNESDVTSVPSISESSMQEIYSRLVLKKLTIPLSPPAAITRAILGFSEVIIFTIVVEDGSV
jgi:hypothetical protein